ncbi:MAG: NusA-like transcription termination signal-binding factor [Candidatus Diapherotrites archaeon]|uniref:NusA-like transcription termination signal-binding factor n=1 Tax=Candidatus Iainarchaeum sp. TaxID=3101447 RepID=A0A2D6M0S0_9ARCH|nr:NusA-like transcription termination signal-binding factor [Candidatus Diapherotrites archaeon]|tara:strand:- start:5389 stop:5802 length:414 start_codon:yes stop_codon:yes gene_type:complete
MKLGSDEIFYINVFDSISGAVAKDVIVQGNSVVFLVKKGDVGKAVGKNACNVNTLRKKFGKNIEILEQGDNPEEFVKKALYTVKIKSVEIVENEDRKNGFVVLDAGEKRKLLSNLGRFKRIKEIAKRNYGLHELRLK